MSTILVTGATGTIGAKLVPLLARTPGVTVRAATRSPHPVAGGVESVAFAFDAPELAAAALRGVDRVFLLAPAMPDQVGASTRFIAQAIAAGVRSIVKLSALDCDVEPTIAYGRAHRDVERVLATSSIAWTCLRPNNFMENLLGGRHAAFAPDAHDELRLPWGTAACSLIAADDIAAVAARVLADDPEAHAGQRYELTGPEPLTFAEVARVLTGVVGRPFRYLDVPPAEARATLLAAHVPPPVADSVLELHALGRAGRAARVTSTVAELLGRSARSFAAFAREHASTWSVR